MQQAVMIRGMESPALSRPMIWTISDLHLSHARPKPMDIFGSHWRAHAERIAQAWRARVQADDHVLIAGDISWAMKLSDALVDLRWIDALPGQKVLIRGNHDYWCPRRPNVVRRQLPPSLHLLSADAIDIGSAVVCGTRGWITPETPGYNVERDQAIYERELLMLERALLQAQQLAQASKPIIALLHYPPFLNGRPTAFADRLTTGGANVCLYGHLHRPNDWASAIQGQVEGVDYQLTACDYLGFGPVAVRGLQKENKSSKINRQEGPYRV